MSDSLNLLLNQNAVKLKRSIAVYLDIAVNPPLFDEKFDALTGRFLRVYETAIQFFRTADLDKSIERAETFRDLIHHVHKLGYIFNEETWQEMRIIRNKVTHDYLPEQFAEMYRLICGDFTKEIIYLKDKIKR